MAFLLELTIMNDNGASVDAREGPIFWGERRVGLYSVLIVDDTPAEVECIRFLLKSSRLAVSADSAANGRDALLKLQAERYDLMITDIKMPLMDGLQLSRAARALDEDMRIVLISGYGEFEYAKTAIAIGVTDYLMKPIVPDEFARTMRSAMDGIDQMRQRAMESASVRRHMIHLTLNREGVESNPTNLPIDYEHMMMLEFESEFLDSQGEDFELQLQGALSMPCDFIALYPVRALMLFRRSDHLTDALLAQARHETATLVESQYGQRCQILLERIAGPDDFEPAYQRLVARTEAEGVEQENHTSRAVDAVIQYIGQHYGESLSLSELAQVFYFSPSYLCHIFKRETGVNLIKFINDLRMKKAQELLCTTQMRINTIAQQVGYKSASYFCQCFRDCFGVTPEQFRQNGR